ncbi:MULTISPECIES: hypothetical protein [Sorangium]|uniref:Uncharacterized protein n=1 Tax=Sorangium cellulosum TaxID=56 RepID=A0A4P2QGQ7_SORCE|nr:MULTISPECIES: hypothetical protein [Sorangium]AUX29127.1 hypothetical protein SOCE836_012140 [Sorangium cellulosum]WCQ88518.1 hypothetical protein NQZ70_01196 [Sorangium sp. Soce836]
MRERLSITLSLKLGGVDHAIPGGDVRGLALEMHSWGVEGWVEFVVQADGGRRGKYTDEILADFQKPDLAEVSLSIEAARLETDTEPADAALKTGGVVLERQLREEVHQDAREAADAISRYYRVRFADPARALWRQHFPCDLLAGKSFKDAIEAHKGAKATLTYDLDALTAAAPHIFFHLDPASGSSFYDLVLWCVRHHDGVFAFDHAQGTYAIKKAKDASGAAAELPAEDVARLTSIFPEIPRHKPRVVCSYTEATRAEPVENANAADGVYRDVLLRTPIAKDVDDRVALEKARPLLPGREVEVVFRRFPTVATAPGSLVSISGQGGHSPALLLAEEPWRVYRLSLEARAADEGPEQSYGEPSTAFDLTMSARLEAKTEPALRLPPIVDPRFPGYLEGKVVSAVGEDTDITYQLDTDQDTSAERYKVKIPLFADQEILAPYEPYSGSGTLYLPLYKDERVLVALDFTRARIHALLDWRADARAPADGQGQHLFLGKSAKSNTSVLHDYQDDKPVLRIQRTNDKDTILFQLEEGKLTLKVEEKKG